ncbi:MAG: PA14 domain-containing protein, partial [Verrucomicrobiota bacterium]
MHLFRLIGCPLVLVALLRSAAFGAGTGLTGQYFDGSDFTTLKLTRVDPTVNFNWGTAAPTNTMAADTFSVRWSGQVEARYSETYIFHVTADDGARLWVNDRMVLARTAYSAAGLEMTGRIELQAGQRYNLILEFIENTGNANVKLEWSSASQSREIIPQSQLYATSGSRDAGSILVERWWNLPGTNLSTLTSSANYPNRPDGREFLTS